MPASLVATRLNGSARTLWSQTLVTPHEVVTPGWVTIDGPTVTAMGGGRPPSGPPVFDLGDRVLAPGFVDIHVHGAVGAQVNGGDPVAVASAVRRVAAYHARHGTTALLATTVSDTLLRLAATVAGIGTCVRESDLSGARVLGAHLEGPWIAAARAGAHDPSLLRTPSIDELRRLCQGSAGVIRMITVAPELPGGLALITELAGIGVVASVGHTEADLETTRSAFDAGARHLTHAFNAMPGLHHRRPGPVGAALTDDRVSLEVIADGNHLDPLMVGLVLREAPERVVAVTDAMSATGLGPGRFTIGHVSVVADDDRVVLAEAPGTLAGSTLTMDRAVANLVAAGASLSAAVRSASATPARVIGVDLGVIRVGGTADLVVLSSDLRCAATLIGGRVVFDPGNLLG